MKRELVFLYGPPAAGKLTVATALASKTGYKLFHNHSSFDMLCEILPPFTPPFSKLMARIRLDVFETALGADVNLITTMVYAKPHDDSFMNDVREVCDRVDAHLTLVQLLADTTELERRVEEQSRASYRKVRDVDKLRGILTKWNCFDRVTEDDLSIDTTSTPPDVSAHVIANRLLGSAGPRDVDKRTSSQADGPSRA